MYKIIVSKQVIKYLHKLPADVARDCAKQIANLAVDKTGYRYIGGDGPYELRELRFASHRVYYLVENGLITVDLIAYDGQITVARAGTKDQQKRQIAQLKKEHNLREQPKTYRKKSRMTTAQRDQLLDLMIGRAFRIRSTGDYLTIDELVAHLERRK